MLTRLILLPLCCVILLLTFSNYAQALPPNDKEGSALIDDLIKRADNYIAQAQYEQALELLTKAYQTSEQVNAKNSKNDVLNSMANVYYNTGQLEQAYRYYTELVELDRNSQDKNALSISLFNLGHVNASRKQFSKADNNFQEALDISQSLKDDLGAASALKALGVNAQAQSKLLVAQKHLKAALKIFIAIHDKTQSARVQRHLGDIAQEQQRYPQARDHYFAALSVLQKQPFSKALMRTHRGLSASYQNMGNIEQALEHHQRYASLQKQLLEQQNKEVTQRLQVQFETQRFAAENEQLNLMNQQQVLELEHRQATLKMQYLMLLLALAILALMIVLWTRSQKHAKAMQKLATRDELTNLQNRRSLMQYAMREWHRSTRFNRDYCCIAIDIDHFKNINDTWGHATGDQVLKLVSSTIHSTLRVTDSVGRIGGEEFLLICIETNKEQAVALAERIRSKVENLQHPHQPGKPVTISLGVAQLLKPISLDELIAQADDALYKSKNNGRNRVTLYQEPDT